MFLTSLQSLPDVIIHYAKLDNKHLELDWLTNNTVFHLEDLYENLMLLPCLFIRTWPFLYVLYFCTALSKNKRCL